MSIFRLGAKSKIYKNSATFSTPTWGNIDTLGDAKLNITPVYAGGQFNDSAVERGAITGFQIQITGSMRRKDDALFTAMNSAAFTGAAIDVMVLDGSSSDNGAVGVRMPMVISAWNRDQGQGQVIVQEFTLQPAIATDPPQTVVITGGVPVFTTLALA